MKKFTVQFFELQSNSLNYIFGSRRLHPPNTAFSIFSEILIERDDCFGSAGNHSNISLVSKAHSAITLICFVWIVTPKV